MYTHMPHGFGGMRRRTHGRKGGTSPNAGKKRATYEVPLPDGTKAVKHTFQTNAPEATAMVYYQAGQWFVASVEALPQNWPDHKWVNARRIK